MRHPAVILVILLGTHAAFAQQRFDGKRQYPQARSVSGLAGGGSAVTPNGKPSNKGALALSTPIAYTISEDHAVLTGGTTSSDANLRWFDGDVATNGSNGTAVAMFGQRIGDFDLGVSLVQTSRLSEDRVVNLQFAPRRSFGRLRVAAGVQDLLDQTVTTPDYGVSTRSLFIASTYEAGGKAYVTGGVGTHRFQSGFLSASAPLVGSSRWMVEHDGYGWNYGVGIDLFKSDVAAFVGVCQGRYATWSLSLRF
jgi:hypothetical protein